MSLKFPVLLLSVFLLQSCSSLTLENVDFAWPIEAVLEVDDSGIVHEERYSITIPLAKIFNEEKIGFNDGERKVVRIIRSSSGYYFITAKNFRSVYVFEADDSALTLKNTILIGGGRIESPAFNQRSPFIELLVNDEYSIYLTADGIKDGEE